MFLISAVKNQRKWVLASMLGVLLLAVAASFIFAQQILCVDTGDVRADVIVVLGGGCGERPERAAELFRLGVAPRVLVTGNGDARENERLLLAKGVPAAAITIEGGSASTKQNAQFSIPLLRKSGAKRVVLVTSWYHSRRALKCFRHYAPDLVFYSRPAYYGYERSEWRNQGVRKHLPSEYVKMVAYWILYGVCPI